MVLGIVGGPITDRAAAVARVDIGLPAGGDLRQDIAAAEVAEVEQTFHRAAAEIARAHAVIKEGSAVAFGIGEVVARPGIAAQGGVVTRCRQAGAAAGVEAIADLIDAQAFRFDGRQEITAAAADEHRRMGVPHRTQETPRCGAGLGGIELPDLRQRLTGRNRTRRQGDEQGAVFDDGADVPGNQAAADFAELDAGRAIGGEFVVEARRVDFVGGRHIKNEGAGRGGNQGIHLAAVEDQLDVGTVAG